MLLTSAEISRDQPVDLWFCLRAQPKREHIAAACLRHIPEVEVFCPRVRFRKRTNRGLVWFVESMFPGYLFARFDYTKVQRRVRGATGIAGFVQFGDRLGLLSHSVISDIKMHAGPDEIVEIAPSLEPGERVEITQGPFQGFVALVSRVFSARNRVEILIDLMGRTLYAEASALDLLSPHGRA